MIKATFIILIINVCNAYLQSHGELRSTQYIWLDPLLLLLLWLDLFSSFMVELNNSRFWQETLQTEFVSRAQGGGPPRPNGPCRVEYTRSIISPNFSSEIGTNVVYLSALSGLFCQHQRKAKQDDKESK